MSKTPQGRRRRRPDPTSTHRSAGVPPGDRSNYRVGENGTVALGTAPLRTLANWRGPILIAVVATGMLIWTWETWPDVLIDFGVERYIPWRLAQGEVLYRDISFHNGPLSQYFNSVCFRIFGSSLRTLVFCNLALLAMLIALLYHALRQVSRRSAATAACVVFVLLFAFAQFAKIGNYNYVCPYAHEMTHGLMLSLAAVVAAWPRGGRLPSPFGSSNRLPSFFGRGAGGEGLPAVGRHPSPLPKGEGTCGIIPKGEGTCFCAARNAASGLLLGLAFLTKAEVFLAGAAATLAALLLNLWLERPGWSRGLVRLSCFAIAFIIPPAIAFLCLASAMPVRQAWLGTLGSWVIAVRSDIVNLPFYRASQGMDCPWENLWAMLSMTGLYAIVLVPAAIIGLMLRRPGQYRTVVATAVLGVTVATLFVWRPKIDWFGLARPWPLLIFSTILAIAIRFWPHRREEAAQRRFVREISLLIFAMVLLAKIFLFARIFHYGFILAMPATLLLVVAALDWVPALIDRRGGFGWVFTAAATALLAVAASTYLSHQVFWIGQKTERVGTGSDAFWADVDRDVDRADCVNVAVEQIAARSSPDTTLAVLPEGVMINCLTGLRNPTSHINFMPVELMLFDEERIVESFQAHPPDLIALVHKDTLEMGFQFFGRDYGLKLGDWIAANYRPWSPSCLIGAMPLQDDKFGILLLEKNADLNTKKPSQ